MSDVIGKLNGENGTPHPGPLPIGSPTRQRGKGEATQLALIDGESDEALLLNGDEFQKRFTGTTAEKLEVKRNGIVALFGCGLPVNFIAQTMHCSERIVKLLGAKYSGLAANSSKEMGKVLGGLAMKAAFHIDQKMGDARVGELGVVMGIALQRKQEMELAGMMSPENEDVVDLEEESPALKSARKFFEDRARLKSGEAQPMEMK
jgi:hypothetical protein